MKTPLIAVFAVCCAAAPVLAQPPPPPGGGPMPPAQAAQPRFGITGGLNVATVRSDDFDGLDVSSKIGLAIGGVVVYPINPTISLVAEGLYSQKGAKLSDGVDSATVSYGYLEVPVALAYNIPTSGNMTPFVFGGVAIALNVSAEISAGGESQDLDGVNSIDFGVVVGAGVQIQTASGASGFVDARYTLGLNDIAEDSSQGSAQHGVFSIMGGYLF